MQLIINILTFVTLFLCGNYVFIKSTDKKDGNFEGKFLNVIYTLSFAFPLNILLDDRRKLNKNEKRIERSIDELNLGHMFNLRSFMALKFLLLFIPLIVILLIMWIVKYYKVDFSILANFNYLLIPFALAYIPDLYLYKKKMEFQRFNFDEVLILQLFMVLLVRSSSTTEDILYAFSKMDTYHKKTFEKAYRMSLRNKSEALQFLEGTFKGTLFGSSFKTLDEMYKYSKEDSVRVLQANFRQIKKDSMRDKSKKELTKFSLSQVSVAIPFSIVVFLGAIPMIQYGIGMISSAVGGL